jgi:hypothetical protein
MSTILQILKAEAVRRGYTWEENELEIKMIRPDGSIAIVARKPNNGNNSIGSGCADNGTRHGFN